jgi:hypothetical protein
MLRPPMQWVGTTVLEARAYLPTLQVQVRRTSVESESARKVGKVQVHVIQRTGHPPSVSG